MSQKQKKSKYVFVTGGVVSSVGKGLISASLSTLLEARGLRVSVIKCDPYINVDPGTLSPFQHGEVYVTEDGAETDLDLGHYERFTNLVLNKDHSITAGQIYQTVIDRERKGGYLGRTVQVIPHITDEIKSRIFKGSKGADITVVEIGGTVGDIEGLPFIEAIRQIRIERGMENTVFAHVTFIPYIPSAGELKSKPTQHSVKALREVGLQPDFLVCRASRPINGDLKSKVALFSNLNPENIVTVKDAETIYEIPLLLSREKLDEKVIKRFRLGSPAAQISKWKDVARKIKNPKKKIRIGLVGKYVHLRDSYQSIHESLTHGGLPHQTQVGVEYINSEKLNGAAELDDLHGILVPGGFGDRGIDGKLRAIRRAREKGIPFFGICLGMQMMALEFARNVCGVEKAASREFEGEGKPENYVIDYLPDQKDLLYKGGSMRLGSYTCLLKKGSLVRGIYKKGIIQERHRHRYEFNPRFAEMFERKGMNITGRCEGRESLIEVLELSPHPWFVGVQFHPEFQSKPTRPHPLFVSFIGACDRRRG